MSDKDRKLFEDDWIAQGNNVPEYRSGEYKCSITNEAYIQFMRGMQAALAHSAEKDAEIAACGEEIMALETEKEQLEDELEAKEKEIERWRMSATKVNAMRHADNATGNSFVPDRTNNAIEVLEQALAAAQQEKL